MSPVLLMLSALMATAPATKRPFAEATLRTQEGKGRAKSQSSQRELKRRTVRVTDETGVAELHVAAGIPTSLSFPMELDADRVMLADSGGRFFDPQTTGRTVVLVPKEDLKRDERVVLQVMLADGAPVPFLLTTVAAEVDLAVDVELELKKRATPDSVVALQTQVIDVQGRLDECLASAGEQGMGKVAALVLAQDPSKPEAFTVERRAVRQLDKQSRLLVQTHHLYRLFDLSYLVLSVENRDPSRSWVMERAEVAVGGGGSATETRVVAVAGEQSLVAPGDLVRIVVGFATPAQELAQHFVLKLYEKGGGRHVELSF